MFCGEDINECVPTSPCQNGGTCNNFDGGFNCVCLRGVTGTLCEGNASISLCAPDNPCMNGGTCASTPGSYTCSCMPGYTGINCEGDINECEEQSDLCLNGGTCVNSFGSYTCQCGMNWEGPDCRECTIDRCLKCSTSGSDAVCEQCDRGYVEASDGLCGM